MCGAGIGIGIGIGIGMVFVRLMVKSDGKCNNNTLSRTQKKNDWGKVQTPGSRERKGTISKERLPRGEVRKRSTVGHEEKKRPPGSASRRGV